MRKLLLAAASAAASLQIVAAHAAPVDSDGPTVIVAAEAVYGDIARQVVGPQVDVTSLSDQATANPQAIAKADLVIRNGLGYDAWMDTLLAASGVAGRKVIVVGDLLHRQPGYNPHLWFDPAVAVALADAIKQALAADGPAASKALRNRERLFVASLQPLEAKIDTMRAQYANVPVAASEPVFGLMAAALGLSMRDTAFQQDIMAGTEPSKAEVAQIEEDLQSHQLRALIYNTQVTTAATEHLLEVAHAAHVPVVMVSETLPKGKTYQSWMMDTLSALDKALTFEPD